MELSDLSFTLGRSYTALNYSKSMANSRLVRHKPVPENEFHHCGNMFPECLKAENPTLCIWLDV